MTRIFRTDGFDRNCLSYWYPQICRVVPTPETFFVSISDGFDLLHIVDGNECWYFEHLCGILKSAAQRIGLPCFLRTGQGSGKHDWDDCCYISDIDSLPNHVAALVNWSHCADFMGLAHGVWVIREMLKTSPLFRCKAFGNMPVVREWRYFVGDGKVLYGIPYWPAEALEQGMPDKPDWRDDMTFLHAHLDGGEELAAKVAKAIDGKWSVDVLESASGDLFVTDMAVAERSWGWRQ